MKGGANLGKIIASETDLVHPAQETVDGEQQLITEMQQDIVVSQKKLANLEGLEERLEMKMYKTEFKASKNR